MAWLLAMIAIGLCAGLIGALFRSGTYARARLGPSGVQEMRIRVEHRYRPSHIELEAGIPTILSFDRREDDPCSEMLVCELLPNQHRLAAHRVTPIRFTPQRLGRYTFTCGMGMYVGELVVRPSRRQARERALA